MILPTLKTNGHSGDVVVFLHGLGGNATSWQPQLSEFGQNFQAMAWNMPGYGDSPSLSEMTFPTLADSLERMLDAHQIQQFHLVGHSMGGMVAQEFIVKRMNRVKSLTLYATSPAFGKPDNEWQQAFIQQRLKILDQGGTMEDVANQVANNLLGKDPAHNVVKLVKASMINCNPNSYRAAVHCLVTFDQRANLANIQIPTLLVAGEEDTIAPANMMEKMANKISGSTFQCIPKAGHLANLEQPISFNKMVHHFISSHS